MSKLATVEKLIALYNAQDADAYAAMFTEQGSEAGYRGDVLREGREGVRAGLKAMFAQFPENRADIKASYELGDYVVLHEEVCRSPETAPFEVVSIYSFENELIERVEFVK
ncbi:nuclear transport factor 2 family protein [Sphingomonas sp. ID0503]|uniref:nuclear transport factor 2 family protein n=1 Tax=Sphingomonas sp. ID0503 TaxID=3399691 RepID=UPI003AFAFDFE